MRWLAEHPLWWGRGNTYLRLNPNPGFSVSLPRGRRLVWSWHQGWKLTPSVKE